LPEKLKVGVHALGYVAETTQQAIEDFYPGYARSMNRIGRERGWAPLSRGQFDAMRSRHGALLVGNPDEVVEKILDHSEALGGISRITFHMDVAVSPQAKLLRAIELLGANVAPVLRR
jgi:alkanesulfonate monooxygenase SsuD/methylene tetrahydromethanopterin reductase-like flavin-dependent oxidoreductase (luciferase family)